MRRRSGRFGFRPFYDENTYVQLVLQNGICSKEQNYKLFQQRKHESKCNLDAKKMWAFFENQRKNIKDKHLLFKKYLDFAGTVFLMLLQINIKGIIEEKLINTISFKGQYLLISCMSQNCTIVIISHHQISTFPTVQPILRSSHFFKLIAIRSSTVICNLVMQNCILLGNLN